MDLKSQRTKVYEYLKKHEKGITSMKAFWLYRITRLSAIIYDLREKGVHIVSIREPNRFNEGYHARYVLLNEKEWWA
jgi:hypothetical protein